MRFTELTCLAVRMVAALAAALPSALLSAPVSAALPQHHYQQARERASHHLQIRVDDVRLLAGRVNNCDVRTTVLRDFRGDMAPGIPLRFTLNCETKGVMPMPGPNAWHDYRALKRARYAEGFFSGSSPTPSPVYGELGLVRSERDSPWCEADTGRCDLPPPSAPLVLECSQPGLDGKGRSVSSGWIVKVQDHRIWYWNDISNRTPGEGRSWVRQEFPLERTAAPLKITPDKYVHETHLYSGGGEQLLLSRRFIIYRATLEFEDRHVITGVESQSVRRGTCREIADPANPAAHA